MDVFNYMSKVCFSRDWIMSNPLLRTPFGQVELRPVTPPPGASEGMRAYVLLPDLDELLGVPGFGLRDPIRISGQKPACKGWSLFNLPFPSLLFH